MATSSCCELIDNINLSIDGCVISISVSSSTESFDLCGEIKTGPTIGSITMTAYADDRTYIGCPAKAGVSIQWLRKYDCENDMVYFIKSGEGQSFITDDSSNYSGWGISSYVRLNQSLDRKYTTINASASSGPTAFYTQTERTEGYGLSYSGDPISFDTSGDLIFPNFGVGEGPVYLQSFSLDLNPGALPVANYSFMFNITD